MFSPETAAELTEAQVTPRPDKSYPDSTAEFDRGLIDLETERLRKAFNILQIPIAIFGHNRDSFEYGNPAFSPLRPHIGSIANILRVPLFETEKGILSAFQAVQTQTNARPIKMHITEGRSYELSVSPSPVPGLDGETNVVVMAKDITTERDLSTRNEGLEKENTHLRAKFQEISAAIGGIVHDIRNPLTIISGYAQALLRGWETYTPDKINEIIGIVITATKKANLEVTNALEGIDDFKEPEPELIQVNDLIESVVEKNGDLTKSNNTEITTFLSDKSQMIEADPKKLRSAFNTLILNSTQSGANKVRIWDRKEEGFVTIYVGDNGSGMTPEILTTCLKDGVTTKKSTGKGLAIAKQNVESCGGKMLPPMSKIGIGSIFAVSFPLAQQTS